MACPGPAGQLGSVRPPRQASPRLPGEGGHGPHRGAPWPPSLDSTREALGPSPSPLAPRQGEDWLPGVWGGGRPRGLCSAPGLAGWAPGCTHLGTGVGGPGACPPCPSLLFASLFEGRLGGGGLHVPHRLLPRHWGGACSGSEPAWHWLGPPHPRFMSPSVLRAHGEPVRGRAGGGGAAHVCPCVQQRWAEPHPQSCLSPPAPRSRCGPGADACP